MGNLKKSREQWKQGLRVLNGGRPRPVNTHFQGVPGGNTHQRKPTPIASRLRQSRPAYGQNKLFLRLASLRRRTATFTLTCAGLPVPKKEARATHECNLADERRSAEGRQREAGTAASENGEENGEGPTS